MRRMAIAVPLAATFCVLMGQMASSGSYPTTDSRLSSIEVRMDALEERVTELQKQNQDLQDTAAQQKDEMQRLESKIDMVAALPP